jgi:hypothetical protein
LTLVRRRLDRRASHLDALARAGTLKGFSICPNPKRR